jgi:transcriptional regulator with XRE-family HTH domain
MIMSENFSLRLKKALEIRNMRQIDLANKTKLDKSLISCYLSGKYEAKQDNVYLLAKALNVSEPWLMGYDVPMESEENINNELKELAQSEFDRTLFKKYGELTEDKKRIIMSVIDGIIEEADKED